MTHTAYVKDALGKVIVAEISGYEVAIANGQLRLVQLDGRYTDLVVVAGVLDTFVMVWPVTASSSRDCAPCLPLTEDTLTVWPDAMFSIDTALIGPLVKNVFTSEQVGAIHDAVCGRGEMPVPQFPEGSTQESYDDLETVCERAWVLTEARAEDLEKLRSQEQREEGNAQMLQHLRNALTLLEAEKKQRNN